MKQQMVRLEIAVNDYMSSALGLGNRVVHDLTERLRQIGRYHPPLYEFRQYAASSPSDERVPPLARSRIGHKTYVDLVQLAYQYTNLSGETLHVNNA